MAISMKHKGWMSLYALPSVVGLVAYFTVAPDDYQAPQPSRSYSANSTTSIKSDTNAELPRIRVVNLLNGLSSSAMTASNWKLKPHWLGHAIVGQMTWVSGNVDSITYTVTDNGVITDSGSVRVPGGVLQKGRPFEVQLNIGTDDVEDVEVVIEVLE